MYVDRVPNRNSRPTYLLRVGQRDGKKVNKRTLANLTSWPAAKIKALKQVLENKTLVDPDDAFAIVRSQAHGHVAAIMAVIKKLKLDRLCSTTIMLAGRRQLGWPVDVAFWAVAFRRR